MKHNIKAIYFDLDDTLCGYWDASRSALRQTFMESGLPYSAEEAISAWKRAFGTFSKEVKTDRWYQHYLESGESTRTELMRRALSTLGVDNDSQAKLLADQYAKLRDAKLQLFEEADSVLYELHKHFRLGLITNGPADVQRQEINTLGIGHYFEHILIEGEFGLGKPEIEIFEAARIKQNLLPSEMLFVGNSFEHDVQGSKLAGWWSLWLNKTGEDNPGTHPQPDAEISNLLEVLDWLGLERPTSSTSIYAEQRRH